MSRRRIEIDLNRVEALASRGLSEEQIAQSLGISRSTLNNRKAESEQFVQAIKKGKAQGIAYVAGKLQKKIEEGDMTAIIFFLKTRAGWSEKQVLDVTTREEVPEGATALYAKSESPISERNILSINSLGRSFNCVSISAAG